MPIPKTQQETAQILDRLANPRFYNAETLVVNFTTSEATAQQVLPPGFEPVEGLRCWARVGRWDSDAVGSFAGATVAMEARFGDHVGFLALAMYMDSEPAILFGRELYGEPKKGATSVLAKDSDGWHAYVERHGTQIIELHGSPEDVQEPTSVTGVGMNIKSTLLQMDPVCSAMQS